MTSTAAGAPPLYGTWIAWMPAMRLKSSPQRWSELPTPEEAKASFPGSFLAFSMSCLTFFAGNSGATIRMCGVDATGARATRSVSARYGRFGSAAALIARPFCAKSSV